MNFTIEKKGYSISEVDSFVEELMSRCQRLQAQNTELEQKLATSKRLIRRFSDTENALKQNIADSKRAAAYMISDARDRSDELLDSARESCGEIISDLDLQISRRMDTVDRLKAEVAAFKDEIFSLYSTHIELMDQLASAAENFEYVPDYAPVAEAVDKFEEAETPVIEAPEFVDYPEESIFAEIAETEDEKSVGEEFVLRAEEALADEDEDQMSFESDITVDIDEYEEDEIDRLGELEMYGEAVETDDALNDAEFDISRESDPGVTFIDEADEDEVQKDETDYFKFLADFANSDDSADI